MCTYIINYITGYPYIWDVKSSDCENYIKCGTKRCQMMRGLQIWPQNSNRITFDPILAQKTVKNCLSLVLANCQQVLAKRGMKY